MDHFIFFNGVNYRLVIIVKIDDNWFKVQESYCSQFMLEKNENKTLMSDAIDDLKYREGMFLHEVENIVSKYPGLGYDVKDTHADQKYDPSGNNVGNSNIVAAVDSTYDLSLLNSESKFFCTYYKAGPKGVNPRTVNTPYVPGVSHPKYCGDLSQYGAQYLAYNFDYHFLTILDFYYSNSGKSDGSLGMIYCFWYTEIYNN